ncbi:phosphatidylcholine:ceramide cholinephosphotransferase 1-like isoform X3 [Varroa destructor]|uniref:Sphingomyelin synthase-like domain-containing protein n=1 Tax=Varroa destructor TaxID=109461 RepID=A0A7M7JCX4_VARDE|nr:phosphatidylcholine:ceramide cholinephosphotransferase 1-like isoform X3 [Varroa destructor]
MSDNDEPCDVAKEPCDHVGRLLLLPLAPTTTRFQAYQFVVLARVFRGDGCLMSSLNGPHSLGGDPLCCGASQEKRPLLRGETPQNCPTNNGISRREKSPDGTTAIIQIPLPAPERAEPRYKPEKCKTLLACIFAVFCLLLNLVVLAFIHDRVPDRTKVPPLPDIFFDQFPVVDQALEVSEIIIIASVWSCVLLIILHRYRWIVFRRICVIMGALYAMRALTMFVTQVPMASKTYFCSPKSNHTTLGLIASRVLTLFSGFGLSINGHHTYCGDYIFSGHTLILTLCYLIVKEYSPQRCRVLHLLYFCTSSIGIFCVLLARGHYTIDVVLGYYVTTRVFWIYHALCAAQQSSKVSSGLRGGAAKSVNSNNDKSATNNCPALKGSCIDVSRILACTGKKMDDEDGPRASDEDSSHNGSQGPDSPQSAEQTLHGSGRARVYQRYSNHDESNDSVVLENNISDRNCNRPQATDDNVEAHLASQSALSYLSRVWWFRIFRYCEGNVTGPVPRQYEWPLPWPRRWLPRTRIS